MALLEVAGVINAKTVAAFVPGDKRSSHDIEIKKSLSVILYGIGKASFGFLGKLFGISRSTTYNWIQPAAKKIRHG